MQNRLRSKVAWGSLLALFYFIMKTWVGFEIPEWDTFVTLLMGTLLGFGIFNNPTNKEGY